MAISGTLVYYHLKTKKDKETSKEQVAESPSSDLELLTKAEVGELFNVSMVTINKWMKYGVLPQRIKMGNKVYFEKKAILDILEKNKRR